MASHPERPYCVSGARLPNTEQLAATTLQLPMHPALSLAQQKRVLAALESATTKRQRVSSEAKRALQACPS